jgi:hypothetical protein
MSLISSKCGILQATRLILLICASSWFGAPYAEDIKGLRVYSASTELWHDMYYLDAQLDYDLSQAAIDALDSGVPLTFELEAEIFQPRKWLWDKSLASFNQRYQVVYHALTQQYIVTNINSGIQNSYSRRNTALLTMGRINHLPLVEKKALPEDENYRVRLRFSLDINALPVPMRPWAYINSEWLLASEWFEWELD